MRKEICLFIAAALCVGAVSVRADRRPVEARWELQNARLVEKASFPHRYYLLQGDRAPLFFLVDPADAALYARCAVVFDFPADLQASPDEALLQALPEKGNAFWVCPLRPGVFPVSVRLEGPGGFVLTYEVDIAVVASLEALPKQAPASPPEKIVDATPAPSQASKAGAAPAAPVNYAHVYGLAMTYKYPSLNKRFMLRGVRLELWESGGALLKSLNASDATGEGNCGLDFEDYIDTTTSAYYHVSDSGSFDFGNIYVGAPGKDLLVREIFNFYSSSNGTDTTGNLRLTVLDADSADQQIAIWWNIGHADSEEEVNTWLYNDSVIYLSSSNGYLADEAMHVLLDGAREYRFWRDCTGYQAPSTICRVQLSDTGSPYSNGSNFHVTSWDNGYLWYPFTDSIRHEYSHCVHYWMRGGNFPTYPPGDVNHGNCANSVSMDGLVEGFARYAPPLLFRDGAYHWTGSSTNAMAGTYDYCTDPTPDDRHEWAVGRGMWQAWTDAGATNAFANCTTDSLVSRDEDYVENTFMGMITDCGYDHNLWAGFHNNSIDYDTTAPPNPSPISVSPNRRWTNDTTPTWSWTLPVDNISGVDGFGLWLTTGSGFPGATKDIEEVTSYTPSALADGSSYYLNMRAVDYAGNWNGSHTYQGPIGIDTVQPGAAAGLHSTSHAVGAWSSNPALAMAWSAASDDRSGLDGYGLFIYSSPSLPGAAKDIEEVTTYTGTLSSSPSPWYFNLRSVDNAGNWDADYVTAGPYYVDTVTPGAVTNLISTSHSTWSWSHDTTIDFTWTAAPDSDSGIDGYGLFWYTAAGSPSNSKDIEEVTAYTQTTGTSTSGYYLNMTAVDNAGNWQGGYVTAGPYFVDAIVPGPASSLASSTHAVGSCHTDDPVVTVTWAAATDAHSGLNGYSYAFSMGSPATPDEVVDLGSAITSLSANAGYTSATRYFNLRARDNAGNWSAVASYGPFTSDRTPVEITGVLVSKAAAPGAVQLDWTASSAVSYQVDRAAAPTFRLYDSFAAPDETYTDDAPPAVGVVYYRVRGVNACGVVGD